MKLSRLTSLFLVVSLIGALPAASAVKPGSKCKKVGKTQIWKGESLTCIKSGKKTVWSKGSPIKTAAPVSTPTPTPSSSTENLPQIPESLDDLIRDPRSISYGAWIRSSQVYNSSKPEKPPINLIVGPSVDRTSVDFSNVLQNVTALFPGYIYPLNNYAYVYGKQDIPWVNEQLAILFTPDELRILQNNEGGKLVESNCRPECLWAKAQYSGARKISLMLFGADVFSSQRGQDAELFKNAIWAHEFLHTMQDLQTHSGSGNTTMYDFPPTWWTEGAAQFVQAVVQSFNSYENYQIYFSYFGSTRLSEEFLNEFLDEERSLVEWTQFPNYTYEIGAQVIEILVSIKGPSIILRLNSEILNGVGFTEAFRRIFGTEWKTVSPKIAKLISERQR